MKKSLVAALNKQVTHELANAHAYRGAGIYFEGRNLHGFAAWMAKQTQDEMTHAKKFIDYLVNRGQKVEIGALPVARTDFPGSLSAFKTALELETTTTALINDLNALAIKEADYATQSMLKWFLDEQVEEEQWANEIVGLISDIGEDHKGGMYMLDHRWGKKATGGD